MLVLWQVSDALSPYLVDQHILNNDTIDNHLCQLFSVWKDFYAFVTIVNFAKIIVFAFVGVLKSSRRIHIFQEASTSDIFYKHYEDVLQVFQSYCTSENMFIYCSRPCSVYLVYWIHTPCLPLPFPLSSSSHPPPSSCGSVLDDFHSPSSRATLGVFALSNQVNYRQI